MFSTLQTPSMLLGPVFTIRPLIVRGTQYMPLSAANEQRLVCGAHASPSGIVLLAVRTKDTFRPPAQW